MTILNLSTVLARDSCHSRRNVVTDAICLQVTFVFGLLRYARNDKNQMAARLIASRHDNPHCVRHDNLLLDGFISFAMTKTLLAKKQNLFQFAHSFSK